VVHLSSRPHATAYIVYLACWESDETVKTLQALSSDLSRMIRLADQAWPTRVKSRETNAVIMLMNIYSKSVMFGQQLIYHCVMNGCEMCPPFISNAIGVRARGLGGCSSQTRAKPLFFGQKLNFSGRSQQPKMKKNIFLYLLNEKTEFILSSEIRDFYWEGWVGQGIFN